MALFPIQASFRGDFVVQLVPVDDQDPMDVVAEKVAHHVVNRRVPPQDAPMRVAYNGKVLPREQTIAEAGIPPLAFLEVFYEEVTVGGDGQ